MDGSGEQHAVLPSGIDICYETFGKPEDPAMLLIMGLSGPMLWWDARFCSALAERGFLVIRYDHRDIGHSSRYDGHPIGRSETVRAFFQGSHGKPPYTLSDLGDDAVGLLDHLGIQQAHVIGVSMGGMVAQTLAIDHPDRVASLVSIMSTTGKRVVGWQDPRIIPLLLRSRAHDKQTYVKQSVMVAKMIGSPGYDTPLDAEEQLAEATYDWGVNPDGVLRQIQAILAQPDRTLALGTLSIPTLVIHGLADKMVHVSGGRATAEAIPGAELMLIPGMGHDLPPALWPAVMDGVERTARRAASAPA